MPEIKITKDNFEQEVMKSNIPVLIDFWAEWCGPCQMLGPVISEIADEYEGKIKVGKVNVDEEESLAGAFGISSIPLLVLMKNGEIATHSVGFRPKEEIIALLNSNI